MPDRNNQLELLTVIFANPQFPVLAYRHCAANGVDFAQETRTASEVAGWLVLSESNEHGPKPKR